MIMCWLFTMLCASFRCCFFGLVLITSRLWGSVCLRPFVFFMDSFFFLAGFQARWPYPRNHFYLCLLSCSLADYRRPVPYLFCLPFPNRASDSGDLYIDFNRNQLIFPVALLDFHVEARFYHSFANHAYASHIASRISYHVCIMLFVHCTWLIVFLLLVVLALGRAGRQVRERGARWVLLRGSRQLWKLCMQDDHTLEITSIFAC